MNADTRKQLIEKTVTLIEQVLNEMKISTTPKQETVVPKPSTPKTPNTEIFEYIRERKDGKVHKVGIIWGTIDNGTIRIGWSKLTYSHD